MYKINDIRIIQTDLLNWLQKDILNITFSRFQLINLFPINDLIQFYLDRIYSKNSNLTIKIIFTYFY